MNTNLKINFWSDLEGFIKSELTSFGYQTPSAKELRRQDRRSEEIKNAIEHYDSERLVMHYFSILMRRIPTAKYHVFISDTIKSDSQKILLSQTIEAMLTAGIDANSHLSNRVKEINQVKKENLDLLLSEWGIHHLHFHADRSNELLLIFMRGTSIYFIDVLTHEDDEGTIETWTNTGLIEIIHRNWPEVIHAYKVNGDFTCEDLTVEQRRNLRDKLTNSFVFMHDGTTYRGPGGGFMVSGVALDVVRSTDIILEQICQSERDVRSSIVEIRSQLKIADSDSLRLQLNFKPNLTHSIYHKNRDKIIRFTGPSKGE